MKRKKRNYPHVCSHMGPKSSLEHLTFDLQTNSEGFVLSSRTLNKLTTVTR